MLVLILPTVQVDDSLSVVCVVKRHFSAGVKRHTCLICRGRPIPCCADCIHYLLHVIWRYCQTDARVKQQAGHTRISPICHAVCAFILLCLEVSMTSCLPAPTTVYATKFAVKWHQLQELWVMCGLVLLFRSASRSPLALRAEGATLMSTASSGMSCRTTCYRCQYMYSLKCMPQNSEFMAFRTEPAMHMQAQLNSIKPTCDLRWVTYHERGRSGRSALHPATTKTNNIMHCSMSRPQKWCESAVGSVGFRMVYLVRHTVSTHS